MTRHLAFRPPSPRKLLSIFISKFNDLSIKRQATRNWRNPCYGKDERNRCMLERPSGFFIHFFRRTAMATVTIKDLPAAEEISADAARNIVGGRIKQREGGAEVPPLDDPSGGMGYTGILIHYTLTVIE
ncbi:hypothetical protein [Aromatoleum buckelii]|uniref:Uncharacterized protein n=1 Tax=Aromatoleum buckelii TaxID=200254 RepID=A0ABX1N431_9RHOO|nr:hypothetical protein [Aromatoleum buckelii]MCK0510298.1 hypothetical protein [Aromatoleum buckelii]